MLIKRHLQFLFIFSICKRIKVRNPLDTVITSVEPLLGVLYSVFAGSNAALASVFAKIAFDSEVLSGWYGQIGISSDYVCLTLCVNDIYRLTSWKGVDYHESYLFYTHFYFKCVNDELVREIHGFDHQH